MNKGWKISVFVCAVMLVGIICPTCGQAESQEGVDIEVLRAEGDYGEVRVGNYIIYGTPDHVEIATEWRGIVATYGFTYHEVEGGYEVTAYDERSGREIATVAPNPEYQRVTAMGSWEFREP